LRRKIIISALFLLGVVITIELVKLVKNSYYSTQFTCIIENEKIDCDTEGAFFKIKQIEDSEIDFVEQKIVFPVFDGEEKFVKKQYDRIYSTDSCDKFTIKVLVQYSRFSHNRNDLGCTGAHKLLILKIDEIKKENICATANPN
jgi:hypothetical protein